MKKRLISALLTVLMVVALFNGIPVTASAEAATVSYTLKPGDVVINVCKDLGINFYVNMNWIMRANNITSFNTLKAGRTLILPAPGTAPSLNDLPGSSNGGTTQTPATGTGPVSGALMNGDYVYEYLVYHTMVAGDTVGALCNAYGVDFASNSERIMKINNIKSYNRIPVGRTVLLPCVSLPNSGSCLRVIAHKIVSGDTTYGICNSYGISYDRNAALMKVLNNKDNLAAIKAGQILYVPVPATITNGSVAQPGQSGQTGGNNNKPADTTEYTITANTANTSFGSYTVSASKATSGTKITVKVSPKTNYAMGSIVVKDANGKGVSVTYGDNSGTFSMPSSNVTVTVNFVSATQYAIKLDKVTVGSGSFETWVNGKAVDKAAAGQIVKVVASPGYKMQIDDIQVYTGKDKDQSVTVNDDDTFVMPQGDVLVRVSFKAMQEFAITKKEDNGSFSVTLNGTEVSQAMPGEIIKINLTPAAGYEVDKITVAKDNGTGAVEVNNNSFTMPRYAVTVTVTFKAIVYNITASASENGSYEVRNVASKQLATTATVGENVWIVPTAAEGYQLKAITVTSASGKAQYVNEYKAFAMPAEDVTVKVEFEKILHDITSTYSGGDANNRYTVTVGGKTVNMGETIQAGIGDTVTLTAADDLYTNYKYRITGVEITGADGVTATVSKDQKTATFTMPNAAVTVKVNYTVATS